MAEAWFTKNARQGGKSIRLARLLSQRGFASRRVAEEWIRAGRVRVNGRAVTNPQLGVHPELDEIAADPPAGARAVSSPSAPGAALRPPAPSEARKGRVEALPPCPGRGPEGPGRGIAPVVPAWWMLNKPAGCLTAARDPEGRKTVYDFLPKELPWMAPVGRLDFDSSGLLLFTNETAVAAALRDPGRGIPKVYEVVVRGGFPRGRLRDFDRVVPLGRGEAARPARARLLGRDPAGSRLELTLTEGKKREVRRMLRTLGFEVVRLRRTAFGPVRLGDLAEGTARPLEAVEIESVRGAVGRGPL